MVRAHNRKFPVYKLKPFLVVARAEHWKGPSTVHDMPWARNEKEAREKAIKDLQRYGRISHVYVDEISRSEYFERKIRHGRSGWKLRKVGATAGLELRPSDIGG